MRVLEYMSMLYSIDMGAQRLVEKIKFQMLHEHDAQDCKVAILLLVK